MMRQGTDVEAQATATPMIKEAIGTKAATVPAVDAAALSRAVQVRNAAAGCMDVTVT